MFFKGQYVCEKKYMVLLCFVFSISHEICIQLCCVLSYCYIMSSLWVCGIYLPISYRVTSLTLGQSYDCPSVSEVTLKDMGEMTHAKLQQDKPKCIILEIYCIILPSLETNKSCILLCMVHCIAHLNIHWTSWISSCSWIFIEESVMLLNLLKTSSFHDANFVTTGGTIGCHNDNFQCHQS